MNTYYIYVLSSRNHKHLSVKATTDLKHGVRHHRRRISRALGRKKVYQKVVMVETFQGLTSAVAREREMGEWTESRLRLFISQRNPTWKAISIREFLRRSSVATDDPATSSPRQSPGLQGAQ